MDSFIKGMYGFVFCFVVLIGFWGIFECAEFIGSTKWKLKNLERKIELLEKQNDETIQKQLDRDINGRR